MKKFYFILFALLTLNFSHAQGPIVNPDIVAIRATNIIGPTEAKQVDGIRAIGLTRGNGLTLSTQGNHTGFVSDGFNQATLQGAIDNDQYIEWSINVNPHHFINISNIRLAATRHNKQAVTKFAVRYKTNTSSTWTTIYNGTHSGANKLPENERFSFNTNISLAPSSLPSTVTFRLYAYDGADHPYAIGTLSDSSSLMTGAGILMNGNVTFDGLVYNNGNWSPIATGPTSATGSFNALIKSGTYTVGSGIENDIVIKNLILSPSTKVVVPADASITVNEDLTILGTTFEGNTASFELQSTSTNYSSLIVNRTVDGKVTYKRHVNSYANNNDFISAPVTGERFDLFHPNNTNIHKLDASTFLFGPLNKTTGTYTAWTETSTATLLPAEGYRVASTDGGTFTFRGTVNTGTISRDIRYGGTYYKKWNAIGNPYPSYIDAYKFLEDNLDNLSSTVAAIYGYDGDSSDGWAVWNLSTLEFEENPYITPGQGFYVAANDGGGRVNFTPDMRLIKNSDDFIPNRPSNTRKGRIELKITNANKTFSTELYFNEHASKSLDRGYDAAIFGGKAPNFAVFTQLVEDNTGEDLAIQSLNYNDLSNDVIIPIGINATKGQQITVSLENMILPEGTEVYLEDNVTNTTTLLNNSNYSLTVSSNLKDTGRFFLRVSNTTTLSTDSSIINSLHIYATSKTVYIKGSLNEKTIASVYDVQGREISTMLLKSGSNTNQINLSQVHAGVYIVKLKNNIEEKTQKVILK